MYGLLLMTALATGGDAPSFGGRLGGCSGSSCYGSYSSCSGYSYGCSGYSSCSGYSYGGYSSCSGYSYGCSGYSSCYGSSCYGSSCSGGSGLFGLRAHFASHSCCGGQSWGCGGWSSGYGCCGGYSYTHGGWSSGYGYGGCCGGGYSYGGCCGGAVYYGTPTYAPSMMTPVAPAPAVVAPAPGSPAPAVPMIMGMHSGSPAAAAYAYNHAPRVSGINYSSQYYSGPNYAAYPNGVGVRTFSPGYTNGGGFGTGVVGPYFYGADHRPYVPAGPIPGTLANPLYDGRNPAAMPVAAEFEAAKAAPTVAAPARMTVELPAEAKFYVDGMLTKGTGPVRSFHTPDLAHGKTFFYDLKAEVTVEGKLVVETKRVLVRGGEELSESFPKLIAAAKTGSKEPTAVAAK